MEQQLSLDPQNQRTLVHTQINMEASGVFPVVALSEPHSPLQSTVSSSNTPRQLELIPAPAPAHTQLTIDAWSAPVSGTTRHKI